MVQASANADQYSQNLEDRVQFYINNPGSYTDLTYKHDPQAYLATPVYQQFAESFGRAPTKDEYAVYSPQVVSLGHSGLRAEIAKLKLAEANSPDAIAKKDREKKLAEAPKYYESVNGLFQSTLGRTATEEERKHFGSLLSAGTTDEYELGNFLKQQPEYTQKQDEQFQQGLSGKLQASDKQYFQEQILPSIQQTYAKQGRSFDSSAFQNAATQSAQAQNTNRENYLAQLSAQQYGGRQSQAYQDYAGYVQNQQNMSNMQNQAQYSTAQGALGRSTEVLDYQRQADAYNQYLAKYGKRSGTQGAMGGATAGATIGSSFGPWGTAIGAGVGAIGGYFGSQY